MLIVFSSDLGEEELKCAFGLLGRTYPYSIAGSDGSISASVASIQPQASSSSAPSSPGSRHSVSTLKKWLTNPVRKLSAGGLPRGDRPLRKAEGRMRRHGRQEDRKSIDLGLLGQVEGPFAVPREPIGTLLHRDQKQCSKTYKVKRGFQNTFGILHRCSMSPILVHLNCSNPA
uniref:Uncharacterized protein n=1 Tax=Sphaerodactylus townsendi TaxID=933632 RepID=A0ACB8ENA5_9SAUR